MELVQLKTWRGTDFGYWSKTRYKTWGENNFGYKFLVNEKFDHFLKIFFILRTNIASLINLNKIFSNYYDNIKDYEHKLQLVAKSLRDKQNVLIYQHESVPINISSSCYMYESDY